MANRAKDRDRNNIQAALMKRFAQRPNWHK